MLNSENPERGVWRSARVPLSTNGSEWSVWRLPRMREDWAWQDGSPEELSIESLSNLTGGFCNKSFSLLGCFRCWKVQELPQACPLASAGDGLPPLTFVLYLVITWTSCCVLSFGWGWSYSLSADTKGMIVPNHRKERLNRWGQTQNKATNSRMCFETWNNISPFSFQNNFHAHINK